MVNTAHAAFVTITFEGQSNAIYSAPITRSGYVLRNPIGQEQHFHEITSTGFGLPNNGTGVLLNDRNTEIEVTAAGLTPFSLTSVDVGAALGNQAAVGLAIVHLVLEYRTRLKKTRTGLV